MLNLSDIQIDYSALSPELADSLRHRIGYFFGLIWCAIYLLISYFCQCYAKNRFKKLYPDEKIIYVVTSGVGVLAIATYLFGAMFGLEILPFIIFKNIYVAERATIQTLWFYAPQHIFLAWFMLARVSITCILSNKRLNVMGMFWKISENQKIKNNILYKDIDSLEIFYLFIGCPCLQIHFKDNRSAYNIPCIANIKKTKEIILQFINEKNETKMSEETLLLKGMYLL